MNLKGKDDNDDEASAPEYDNGDEDCGMVEAVVVRLTRVPR